ncbi:hypothetical protein EXIGLDRAFT_701145 [Exidia glandulosa HHB12029]|uniref:Uncharacterized protein n=1 Tax=Exidia glandulosa HHB12029 TaxID=1314781 RepID=A0A165D340_EXIGL|nr:hypothetical protein EXIGLDRAFT_701145 [Exidia glandulosa HHB12029]
MSDMNHGPAEALKATGRVPLIQTMAEAEEDWYHRRRGCRLRQGRRCRPAAAEPAKNETARDSACRRPGLLDLASWAWSGATCATLRRNLEREITRTPAPLLELPNRPLQRLQNASGKRVGQSQE